MSVPRRHHKSAKKPSYSSLDETSGALRLIEVPVKQNQSKSGDNTVTTIAIASWFLVWIGGWAATRLLSSQYPIIHGVGAYIGFAAGGILAAAIIVVDQLVKSRITKRSS